MRLKLQNTKVRYHHLLTKWLLEKIITAFATITKALLVVNK